MRLGIFRNGLKARALGLALLWVAVTGCSQKRRAAELVNSVAHQFNVHVSTMQQLPQNLVSGDCANQIAGSGEAVFNGTSSGIQFQGTFNIAFAIDALKGVSGGASASTSRAAAAMLESPSPESVRNPLPAAEDALPRLQLLLSLSGKRDVIPPPTVGPDDNFVCNLQVSYLLDANGTFTGPGSITACDSTYSCRIKGDDISCEDLQKYMATYTCSSVDTF